ncbi:MAG: CotH kinase family protein [Gemmatimonadota bacterium]|nr:CotH kinase family protein [Gemmatimonadota bacterium]
MVVLPLVAMAWLGTPAEGRVSARMVDLGRVPDSVLSRPRLAVLEVDTFDIRDLMDNPGQRGRRWERLGRIAFLTDGEVTFESVVGVRIAGRSSRFLPVKSLRLFFRASAGATRPAAAAVGLDGDVSYESLVLHGDVRPYAGTDGFHYSNSIAYAITRRLGLLTAATVPVTLVINGGAPAPYVTTEHLTAEILKRRLGIDSLVRYDLREPGDRASLELVGPLAQLRQRFGRTEGWTMEQIGTIVDLDNLLRWLLSILFNGTQDTAQGILLHDLDRDSAQWYWVPWDYDVSFGRLDEAGRFDIDDYHLRWLKRTDLAKEPDARATLLRHLFRTSEPFRQRFHTAFLVARDSLVTPEFLEATMAEFEAAASTHGIADVRYQALIRQFLTRRAAVLTAQLPAFLDPNHP